MPSCDQSNSIQRTIAVVHDRLISNQWALARAETQFDRDQIRQEIKEDQELLIKLRAKLDSPVS